MYEVSGLDSSVVDAADQYANQFKELPAVAAALLFGAGSVPRRGGRRELTPAAMLRVVTIGAYLLVHENELSDTEDFRLLFSGGWSAGNEQREPIRRRNREGPLLLNFADELGLRKYFAGAVVFEEQSASCSTISDAVYAAQCEFFRGKFGPERQLANVAQREHMGRCVDSTCWAFCLKPDAILEIEAPSDGRSKPSKERFMRAAARLGTLGARDSHPNLLRRDAKLTRAHRISKGNFRRSA